MIKIHKLLDPAGALADADIDLVEDETNPTYGVFRFVDRDVGYLIATVDGVQDSAEAVIQFYLCTDACQRIEHIYQTDADVGWSVMVVNGKNCPLVCWRSKTAFYRWIDDEFVKGIDAAPAGKLQPFPR